MQIKIIIILLCSMVLPDASEHSDVHQDTMSYVLVLTAGV